MEKTRHEDMMEQIEESLSPSMKKINESLSSLGEAYGDLEKALRNSGSSSTADLVMQQRLTVGAISDAFIFTLLESIMKSGLSTTLEGDKH